MRRPKKRRSTPEGEHRPVLLQEILRALGPRSGMIVVDCTVGWAGHSVELLTRIGPSGMLIGLDLDAENLPKARERLASVGHPFHLHHANFAGLQQVLATHGITRVDALLADLGMSSMQVDDPERGFSYVREGPLDMRMDRSRGRTAAQILATIAKDELIEHLTNLGDEPDPERIASAIVQAREKSAITTTKDLSRIIQEATKHESGGSIQRLASGICTPRLAPSRPCASWSIANWPIWNISCESCRNAWARGGAPPLSASTAAKIAW